MIATASAEQYREAITTLAAWDGIDALIVIFIRPLLIKAEDVAEAVREAVDEMPREIPVQAVFMSVKDQRGDGRRAGTHLPVPRARGRSAGRVMRHVDWRGQPAEEPPEFDDIRDDEAAAVIADALGSGNEWMEIEVTPAPRLLRDRGSRAGRSLRCRRGRPGRGGDRRRGWR